jgi:hypothetical protein
MQFNKVELKETFNHVDKSLKKYFENKQFGNYNEPFLDQSDTNA